LRGIDATDVDDAAEMDDSQQLVDKDIAEYSEELKDSQSGQVAVSN